MESIRSKQRLFELQGQVEEVIQRDYPEWQVRGLTKAGSGLENVVFRAETDAFGSVAIRVPWVRFLSNANDPELDARDLLQKEMVLANHLRQYGLPTPQTFHMHEDETLVFTVAEFVENDGSEVDHGEMGRIVAKIHEVPLPEDTFSRRATHLNRELSERISRRTAILERLTGISLPLPEEQALEQRLTWPEAQTRILHMDIRSANILSDKGEIRALVDWSNALFGDPGLDLARTVENGFGDESFLRGYGMEKGLIRLPKLVETLYRLDTATMLANVFLSEAPDPIWSERQVKRVLELHAILKKEW